MIKLNHLDKYFFKNKRNEIHVLNDVNLDFPDHGLIVLLGPSGSGKTTLLNVIGGLDKIQSGEITFEDQTIKGYKANKWDEIRNERVGYIFQNYNLLPQLSVYENVAFVLRLLGITDEKRIESNVEYILKAVGMYKFRKKKATQLSGGQQQRVAIARALVKNPEIVIADEPTGNLDSKNTFDIMKIIKEISKNKLVVLVTHEKNIANIYGDRIIELKDGQIIDDRENASQFNYEHQDEDIVYLKDMHQSLDHEDLRFAFKMYEEKEQDEPVKVRFIVRNKTLYIDVDSAYKKVKLLDENSNLILKDEHYKKLEKEDYTETSFDPDFLDLKNTHKQKKLFVSFKSIISMAFQKVVQSTRKGKLVLASFIVSGAMVALAMALFSNFIIPNSAYMKYDNDYVIATRDNYEQMYTEASYDDVMDSLGEGDFLNQLSNPTFAFVDKQTNSEFFNFNTAAVDLYQFLSHPRVVEGEVATEDSEIMITTALADSFFEASIFDFRPTLAQEYGIWDYDDLLHEKLMSNGYEYSISGIVRSDLLLIYVSEDIYYRLISPSINTQTNDETFVMNYKYIKDVSNDDLTYGTMSSDDEGVVVTSALLEAYGHGALLNDSTTWPQDTPLLGHILGVVEDDDIYNIWTTKDELQEMQYIITQNRYDTTLYIHTNNPDITINGFTEHTSLSAYEESDYALSQAQMDVSISAMIPMIIIIFGASFLGFYFLMHSRMISRIYEISVYRSLGMKKRELLISHVVEAGFMTTITSIIGYLFASYLLYNLASSPLGYSPFIVSPLSILIGILIVYVINIGAGSIPIASLLRKTPSEISSKFDI